MSTMMAPGTMTSMLTCFDADAAYFQESSNDPAEDDYGFAALTLRSMMSVLRKRFNELRMSGG